MERLGDALAGLLSFAREMGAPAFAASWALGAFLVAAILIRRRHDSFGFKVGASLLAIGGAAGSVLWWSAQPEAEYYKYVDEVVAEAQRFRLRRARLQVHGCVVRGSIERRAGTDEYRFRMQNTPERAHAVLEVRYTGWVPDPFRSGAELVAKGTLDAEGRLEVVPDGILVKCPSKYGLSIPPDWQCGTPGS
jgi:cytochrome c-type biogenesis protein CcmE